MPSSADYDSFLAKRVADLVRENFKERGLPNLLTFKWGEKWKNTLGRIQPLKTSEFGSVIEINPLLAEIEVPEYVLDAVIMHELTHYFQGFGSNHERKHKHPHKGGIVDKELDRLGWEEIRKNADKWIKENWHKHYRNKK
jgi:predicted SprT family Zn-dependent metalloprotease